MTGVAVTLETISVFTGLGVVGLTVGVNVRVRVRVTVGVADGTRVGVKVGVDVTVGVSVGAANANLVGSGVAVSGAGVEAEQAEKKNKKAQRHKQKTPLWLCVFVVNLNRIIEQSRPSSLPHAQSASRHARARCPRRVRCLARRSLSFLRRVDRAASRA